MPEPSIPITIVIFGASGDLTHRKLIPALYNLYLKKRLPAGTRTVGFALSWLVYLY
jgi:glucose-6-phosphate 1-dehydrogenase